MSKTLVANDLDFLKDLPVFDKKVKFLINQDESLVKESYRTFEDIDEGADKTCPGEHVIIHDKKSYDGNITDYTIRAVGDVIIDYHGTGPVVDTNVEQITCSEKDFYNRRSHDIGKELSTGEIKGSTIVDYHTKYIDVKEYRLPGFINMNVFKSDNKDPEHPTLDMIINTEFNYDDNKEDTATILLAREIRQRFHKNGDIYDYKRSNMKYGYDITGELIKMDTKAKELFEGDRGDIVPRMKIDENGNYIVRYVSMDKPYNVHMIETYKLDGDTFILQHITNNDQGLDIVFGWLPEGPGNSDVYAEGCYKYISTFKHDDLTCVVTGYTNRPNSGDLFAYTSTKLGLSFSKSPYFQNIYSGEADGSYFLTNNQIVMAEIYGDNDFYIQYVYEYDESGHLTQQLYRTGKDSTLMPISDTEITTLENGNIVKECCICSDPLDKKNKKSIFYMASEYDSDDILVSQYRTLVVND